MSFNNVQLTRKDNTSEELPNLFLHFKKSECLVNRHSFAVSLYLVINKIESSYGACL